jgi:hypothetical protein
MLVLVGPIVFLLSQKLDLLILITIPGFFLGMDGSGIYVLIEGRTLLGTMARMFLYATMICFNVGLIFTILVILDKASASLILFGLVPLILGMFLIWPVGMYMLANFRRG